MASPLPLQSHHNCLETPKRHKRSDDIPLNEFEVLPDSRNMCEPWPVDQAEDACDQEGDDCKHEKDVQMEEWHMHEADAGELAEAV